MSQSPGKKRLHGAQDPEADAEKLDGKPGKRQRTDEGEQLIKKPLVKDDDSQDEFDPEGKEGSDSFDDDFGGDES